MSVTVNLTPSEMEVAACQGVKRRIRAILRGRIQAHKYDGRIDPWVMDVEGAAAEMAVAKVLGRFFPLSPNLDTAEGDLGDGIQVRSTLRSGGALILHDTDDGGDRFFLVRGRMPQLEVAGSIIAAQGKQERFWRTDTGRPAFFVPSSALEKVDMLADYGRPSRNA